MRLTYGVSNPARAMDFGVNSPGVAPNFILGYLSASEMLSSTVSLSGTLTFTVPAFTTTWIAYTTSFSLKQMYERPRSHDSVHHRVGRVTPIAIVLPIDVARSKMWGAVKAVRVCVVVRSEGRVFDRMKDASNTEKPTQYVDCGGALQDS